jgi:hypothetical protein
VRISEFPTGFQAKREKQPISQSREVKPITRQAEEEKMFAIITKIVSITNVNPT